MAMAAGLAVAWSEKREQQDKLVGGGQQGPERFTATPHPS